MGEKMIFFYNYWFPFSNACLSIYPWAAIICILFYWFLKNEWKHEMVNWLYVFNTILPLITLINLVFFLAELFIAWYGQNPYEWYAFKENRANVFRPYGWSYWLLLLSNMLLPQLLWFKKLRKSTIITFVVVFFSSFGIWFERLVIYITSAYRDYLPSSWSTYPEHVNLFFTFFIKPVCFIIISATVYLVFYKRNKLPYTSVFLK
jgi:hypothetical protein